MESHKPRNGVIIVLICLAIGLVTSCIEEKVAAPDDEEFVNPNKSNANSLIVSQNTFGDPGTWSSIWHMKTDGGGGYYFRGGSNSRYGVGQVSASGDLVWFTRSTYQPRDIQALPQSAIAPNGLLVVGAHDNDSDGENEVGYVSLFGSSGSLLSQIICTSDTSDIWLNSIASISDSTFVVVGAEKTLSRMEPLIAVIALTSADQIEKRHQTVINTISNSVFGAVVTNPAELSDSELTCYVLSATSDESGGTSSGRKISASLPALVPWTVEWTQEIVAKPGFSVRMTTGSLRLFQNNLYMVGSTDDPDKPEPSDGGLWDSAVAASVSLTGELRWLTTVPMTEHSDVFNGCVPTPDGLYAVGTAARFSRSDQKFGYGWISKIALSTGDVVSNMTFGGDSYRSGLNDGVVLDGKIYCGGWTRRETSESGYPAWFCEIDISNPSPVELYESPAPARAGDRKGRDLRLFERSVTPHFGL